MTYQMPNIQNSMSIVTADWLKQQLDIAANDIVVLDVTWYSTKDATKDFLLEHIPGAGKFDIMKDVENTELFPRNLPTPEAFQQQARSLGINDDSHVVIYDNTPFAGYFVGGRTWWMFRLHGHDKVSVLDGALQSWRDSSYPVTTEVITPKPGNFKVRMNLSLKKSHQDMVENLTTRCYQVCDTRAYADYKGHPNDSLSGHYPGAVSMTLATTLIDKEKNRLHSVQTLHQIFEERGIDVEKPIVGMCKSGMSSCTVALIATLCGATDVAVYLGGYREWISKAKEGYLEQTITDINCSS